jgi:hypothetical protein
MIPTCKLPLAFLDFVTLGRESAAPPDLLVVSLNVYPCRDSYVRGALHTTTSVLKAGQYHIRMGLYCYWVCSGYIKLSSPGFHSPHHPIPFISNPSRPANALSSSPCRRPPPASHQRSGSSTAFSGRQGLPTPSGRAGAVSCGSASTPRIRAFSFSAPCQNSMHMLTSLTVTWCSSSPCGTSSRRCATQP